jgi:hypothetical protein
MTIDGVRPSLKNPVYFLTRQESQKTLAIEKSPFFWKGPMQFVVDYTSKADGQDTQICSMD